MATFNITTSTIYRWRYYIGYGLIAAALVIALIFAGLYVPGGISSTEMSSVVTSNKASILNSDPSSVVNLPYYLLQRASITVFGVHDFSIKLPSLILGFLAAVGIVLLLRRWFAQNIAVLASLIAITTGQFMFIAQTGAPSILYLFWPVWIIYLATLIANQRKPVVLFKIGFFIFAALSLYTPLSIYPLVALGTAILLHPHLRFIVRQLSRLKLLAGLIVALILLLPLFRAIIISPSIALTLIGVPVSRPDISFNLAQLSQQFFGFVHPGGTTLMTPVFGLGSTMLIGIGFYHTIRTRFTAKSYILFIWLLLILIAIILKPTYTSVTFLPLVLLLTTGILALMNYWYRLFPRNPYARIGGLIPIVILVVALVASGLDRYIYGYHYDPTIASSFSHDLALLPKNTHQLVVSSNEKPFYDVVADHDSTLSVVTMPTQTEFTATRDSDPSRFTGYTLDRIITSQSTTDSDRFYIYKK